LIMLAMAAEEEGEIQKAEVMKTNIPPPVKGANTAPLGDPSLRAGRNPSDAALVPEKRLNSLEVVDFWKKTLQPQAVSENPELPAKVVPPQTAVSEKSKLPAKVVRVVLPPSCSDKPPAKMKKETKTETKAEMPSGTARTTKNSLKRPYMEISGNAERELLPPKPSKVMPPKPKHSLPPKPLEGVRKTVGLGPGKSFSIILE
jgi:hypothetical protein